MRLTRRGVRAPLKPQQAARMRRRFRSRHALRLRRFLSADMLRSLVPALERAPARRVRDAGGSESEVRDCAETAALIFLLNDPKLLRWIESLTGVRPLRSFVGRAYRLLPRRKDAMGWHTDFLQKRKLALSINLSRRRYEGGTLRIRRVGSERPIATVPNRGLGNAVLFRVSRQIEHCVDPVRGRHPKIAFAGWFTADASRRPF